MRYLTVGAITLLVATTWTLPLAGAQLSVDLAYGAERNVDSGPSERDGWMSGIVEWTWPSGFGVGLGTDHQFEEATPSPSEHQSWAVFLSGSYEYGTGPVAPFVRVGLGAGRAPCEGDTCSDGVHVRGSGGIRVPIRDAWRVFAELGATRVSRPFGGAGLSIRF